MTPEGAPLSVLVAHLRRDMHFAYLQDDWRANPLKTLRVRLAICASAPTTLIIASNRAVCAGSNARAAA